VENSYLINLSIPPSLTDGEKKKAFECKLLAVWILSLQ